MTPCYENGGLQIDNHLDPQVEQLVAAQPPQDEPAVLLGLPPTEKAKADIIRLTFLLLH